MTSTFTWRSSAPLISPTDGRRTAVQGIKDPSVVHFDGKFHVFASIAEDNDYNLVYLSFTDWAEASSAEHHYLDASGIGRGYRAAPQVFYFEPHQLWYLVYQTGNASYSTNPDIADPLGWSAPKHFYPAMPGIVENNIDNGYWVDMWVICDETHCHLFSSDDNGQLYRSQTPIAQFPEGMSEPVIAMCDPDRYRLFEACNVYRIAGSDRYLLLIEAIGAQDRRYFRSWTAPRIEGPWTALADTEDDPFASAGNVTFDGLGWTRDISHGEVVRYDVDQTMTIDAGPLQYLYQGIDPQCNGGYNSLPWQLALLTQTNGSAIPGAVTRPAEAAAMG